MTMLCTFMAGMKVFEIKLLTVAWWLAGFRPWTASVARSSALNYDSNYPIARERVPADDARVPAKAGRGGARKRSNP